MKIGKALQNFIQVGPGLSFLPSLLLPSFLAPRSAVRHSALGRPVFHGTRERWADPSNPGIKSIFTPIPFLMSLNWTKYDSLIFRKRPLSRLGCSRQVFDGAYIQFPSAILNRRLSPELPPTFPIPRRVSAAE